MQFFTSVVAATLLAGNVLAHPGHDHSAEIAQRAEFMKSNRRDLSQCADKMEARGLAARSVARRQAKMASARQKRNIATDAPYLKSRDAASVDATEHESACSYTPETDVSLLFSGNASCILSPEVTQGPYYVTGEYVREDAREDQEGIELILDTQVIDMATCDPVTNAVIEIWACNATGVYSGVVASGNGDSSDLSNLNATFLRQLQPTSDEGVAQFTTLFPGHYTSRATHFHVLAHFNGTTYENGTYGGGYVSHVGQIFFDQDLITEADTVSPYSTNTQVITLNADDQIFGEEAATTDPVVNYSFIGESISEGIFGWISFGIDLTSQQTISGASSLYAEGGVANSGSSMGGGGGSAPSGSPPSGTGAAPSATASA